MQATTTRPLTDAHNHPIWVVMHAGPLVYRLIPSAILRYKFGTGETRFGVGFPLAFETEELADTAIRDHCPNFSAAVSYQTSPYEMQKSHLYGVSLGGGRVHTSKIHDFLTLCGKGPAALDPNSPEWEAAWH